MRDVYIKGDPAKPVDVRVYDFDSNIPIEGIEELSILLKAGRDTAVIIRTPSGSETCRLVPPKVQKMPGLGGLGSQEPVGRDPECGGCWMFRNTGMGRECGKCP